MTKKQKQCSILTSSLVDFLDQTLRLLYFSDAGPRGDCSRAVFTLGGNKLQVPGGLELLGKGLLCSPELYSSYCYLIMTILIKQHHTTSSLLP